MQTIVDSETFTTLLCAVGAFFLVRIILRRAHIAGMTLGEFSYSAFASVIIYSLSLLVFAGGSIASLREFLDDAFFLQGFYVGLPHVGAAFCAYFTFRALRHYETVGIQTLLFRFVIGLVVYSATVLLGNLGDIRFFHRPWDFVDFLIIASLRDITIWHIAGLSASALIVFFGAAAPTRWIVDVPLRGAWPIMRLIPKLNRSRAAKVLPLTHKPQKEFFFGGLWLPWEVRTNHFAITGCSGSGKTTLIRLFLQTILKLIKKKSGIRALVFDSKRDMIPILEGLNLSCPIHNLNWFDARSSSWDMAADFETKADIEQVTKILIPDESKEPFWNLSARIVLKNVIEAFISDYLDTNKKWTLADVLNTIRTPEAIAAHTSRHPETADVFACFNNPKVLADVLATLKATSDHFRVIAALWANTPPSRTFSITNWLNESSVVVIANNITKGAVMDPINKVFIHRLSELLLESPENEERIRAGEPQSSTWIVLDEFHRMGRVPNFGFLLTNGRSKGVSVLVGLTNINSLRDPKVYGPQQTDVILSECKNKAFLRTDSPEHAKWGQECFGNTEVLEISTRISFSENSKSQSFSKQADIKQRTAVLADELMHLHIPTPPLEGKKTQKRKRGLFARSIFSAGNLVQSVYRGKIGAFIRVVGGAYTAEFDATEAFKSLAAVKGKAFQPRPASDQRIAWPDAAPPKAEGNGKPAHPPQVAETTEADIFNIDRPGKGETPRAPKDENTNPTSKPRDNQRRRGPKRKTQNGSDSF